MFTTRHRHTPRDGHRLETTIDLGDQRELVIRTSKGDHGVLQTFASVHKCEGNSRVHVIGFGKTGDYCNRVLCTQPKRVTEKLTREQHDQALCQIDAIKLAVEMHYDAQQREEAAHA